MLSLGAVSGRMLESYYSKDDYYCRESGEGVVIAGINRTGKKFITGKEFRELVAERLENEEKVEKARLADDLCFSAPKSVSLLAALGSKKTRSEIIQAHREAVQSVINYVIERDMVQARMMTDKEEVITVSVNPDSIVAVRFDHFLSRNLDPQLHSHVLLLNCVQRSEDGKMVAAYLREIYLHKKDLGALYRHELARRLEKMGYEVEWRTDGTFELKGFTREQLKAFSSRREEILEELKELEKQGISGGKTNEIACKDTRQVKPAEINVQALQKAWQEKARELGITLPTPEVKEKTNVEQVVEQLDKRTIVEEVVSKQIRTAGFSMYHRAELEAAGELAKQGITAGIEEIKELVKEVYRELAKQNGGEVQLTQDTTGRERFSFENVVKADAKAELMGLRDNQFSLDGQKVKEVLKKFNERLEKERGFRLSEEQSRAAEGIACAGSDVCVLGRAGAGKTTTMQVLKEVYAQQGKVVIGASFTGAAAKNLEKETGIKSFTIDSLACMTDKRLEKLFGPDFRERLQGSLIIVDEAGMVDSTRAAVVQEFAEKYGMKIAWVGDPAQLKPVGAGSPFDKFLTQHPDRVYEITEIFRQKDPEYRTAAKLMAEGNFRESLEILEKKGWVYEISSKKSAFNFIVEEYVQAVKSGQTALALADTNKDVNRLNNEIRYRLQQDGLVEKQGLRVNVRNSQGKSAGEKEFAVGDKVMFLRNDSRLGVKNGEVGEVQKIDYEKQTLTVQTKDRTITVDVREYPFLSYGYAMTTTKSQGQTVNRVYYYVKTTTAESLYVAATRGKNECYIVTENREKLLEKLTSQKKVDLAGWHYGRNEETKELDVSEATRRDVVKNYSARDDVKKGIVDSASRLTWYSLTKEQKQDYVQGVLEKQEVQQKAEKAIQKAGEFHPDDAKPDTDEVLKKFEQKYDYDTRAEKQAKSEIEKIAKQVYSEIFQKKDFQAAWKSQKSHETGKALFQQLIETAKQTAKYGVLKTEYYKSLRAGKYNEAKILGNLAGIKTRQIERDIAISKALRGEEKPSIRFVMKYGYDAYRRVKLIEAKHNRDAFDALRYGGVNEAMKVLADRLNEWIAGKIRETNETVKKAVQKVTLKNVSKVESKEQNREQKQQVPEKDAKSKQVPEQVPEKQVSEKDTESKQEVKIEDREQEQKSEKHAREAEVRETQKEQETEREKAESREEEKDRDKGEDREPEKEKKEEFEEKNEKAEFKVEERDTEHNKDERREDLGYGKEEETRNETAEFEVEKERENEQEYPREEQQEQQQETREQEQEINYEF